MPPPAVRADRGGRRTSRAVPESRNKIGRATHSTAALSPYPNCRMPGPHPIGNCQCPLLSLELHPQIQQQAGGVTHTVRRPQIYFDAVADGFFLVRGRSLPNAAQQ